MVVLIWSSFLNFEVTSNSPRSSISWEFCFQIPAFAPGLLLLPAAVSQIQAQQSVDYREIALPSEKSTDPIVSLKIVFLMSFLQIQVMPDITQSLKIHKKMS